MWICEKWASGLLMSLDKLNFKAYPSKKWLHIIHYYPNPQARLVFFSNIHIFYGPITHKYGTIVPQPHIIVNSTRRHGNTVNAYDSVKFQHHYYITGHVSSLNAVHETKSNASIDSKDAKRRFKSHPPSPTSPHHHGKKWRTRRESRINYKLSKIPKYFSKKLICP